MLAIIPIIINLARPLIIKQRYRLFDLYFPIFNQYSLFFPLVSLMLTASVFYLEYSNGTYLEWITYGYSKVQLIIAKLLTALILSFTMVALAFFVMALALVGMLSVSLSDFIRMTESFWLFSLIVILINIPLGTLMINLTRNAITTAVCSIILMIINAIFMAAPFGYLLPSVFAYRLGLLPISKTDFFSNIQTALPVGIGLASLWIVMLFLGAIWQFSSPRKIEG
jgi:ABC-type transport system involved in multi-copper enzyme maturation permease subunit